MAYQTNGQNSEEYTIATPENITFGYEVAGIGSRFIGALVDTIIIAMLLLLINLLVAVALGYVADDGGFRGDFEADPGWLAGLVIALYALFNFAIIWGYFIFFELGWHGQTPGKRLAGTRVVRLDGSGAGFLEVAIRNLVRIVDFMPFAYAVGFVTMFFNRNARRLGDFAAGTLVIRQQREIRLDQLGHSSQQAFPAQGAAPANAVPAVPNIRRLTADEYQLVCDLLDRQMRGRLAPDMVPRVALALAAKLDAPVPGTTFRDYQRFLYQIAETYRNTPGY
ncbi:MAG: RDD family protein [Caldilinea sp.]|nr:RDD family protein [Caldilinea sp.]